MIVEPQVDLTYWKQFFDPNCRITSKYHKMDDGSALLVVTATPEKYDQTIRPVLLVPGWFSQPPGWIDLTKTVSAKTKLIYFETREKNSSVIEKSKSTEMSIERMGMDLDIIKDELGIEFESIICVGSSLGGSALLYFLHMTKLKPYQTVLISPNPDFKLPPIIGRIMLSSPLFMIRLVKKYVKWHVLKFRIDAKNNPEQAAKYISTFDAADPWKARTSAQQVTKFKAWDFLPLIRANVILAGATTDKMHKSERTIKVGKLIKNANYIDFWSNMALHSAEFGEFIIKLVFDKEIENLESLENE